MKNSLLLLTRFVVAVSGVVNLILSLIGLLAPSLINTLLWSPPFEPLPALWIRFAVTVGVMLALGAAYVLKQDNWMAAHTYLGMTGAMVALQVIVTVSAAVTPPGAPTIAWVYVVLGLIYLPIVVWAWSQQAAQARPA